MGAASHDAAGPGGRSVVAADGDGAVAWSAHVRELDRRTTATTREAADVRDRTRRLRARRVVRLILALVELVRRPWRLWRLPWVVIDALRSTPLPPAHPTPELPRTAQLESAVGPRRPPAPRRAAYPHLRIAHVGSVAGFAGIAAHEHLDADRWDEQMADGADLLLVEPPLADWPLQAITAACAEVDVPTVLLARHPDDLEVLARSDGFDRFATDDPSLAAAATERAPGADTVLLPPAISPQRFNPAGWQVEPDRTAMLVVGDDPDPARLEGLDALLEPFADDLSVLRTPEVDPDRLPGPLAGRPTAVLDGSEALAEAAKEHRVALSHPGLFPTPTAHLRHVLALLACGTPTIHPPDADLERTLPGGCLHPAGTASDTRRHLEDLGDAIARERRSIAARRHVLTHHTDRRQLDTILEALAIPTAPPPTVSVLLVTNRPHFLERAHEQIARQTYPHLEIITVCHGDGFDRTFLDRLNAEHPHRTLTLEAPGRWTLGDAVNLGLDHATGEIVTKMDDDDLYGPEHLTDLVLALDYSAAEVVGKWQRFAYLTRHDLTVFRRPRRLERDINKVSGAAMMMARETALTHRFLRVDTRVDTTFNQRVRADGGRVYATHSFDFVIERHGQGHTWVVDDRDHFIDDAVRTVEGVELDETVVPALAPVDGDGRPDRALRADDGRPWRPVATGQRGADRLDGRWPPPGAPAMEATLKAARRDLVRARHDLNRLRGRRAVRVALALAEVARRPTRLWRLPATLVAALRSVDLPDPPPPREPPTPQPLHVAGDGPPPGSRLAERPRYPHLRVLNLGTPVFAEVAPNRPPDPAELEEQLGSSDLLLVAPTADEVPDDPAGTGGADPAGGARLRDVTAAAHVADVPAVLLVRDPDDLTALDGGEFDLVVSDDPELAERAAARAGAERVLIVAPAVSLTRFNPAGWEREPAGSALTVVTADPSERAVAALAELADDPTLDLRVHCGQRADPARLPASLRDRLVDLPGSEPPLADLLRDHRVVISDPVLHTSRADHLRHVLAAAACGTPVVTVAAPGLDELLPGGLVRTVADLVDARDAASDLLGDPDARERLSVRARRHVVTHHALRDRFDEVLAAVDIPTLPPETVSVLLPTHRSDFLERAADNLARQTYPHVELIVILHGDGPDRRRVARLTADLDLPTVTVEVPGSVTFGDCLNAGLAVASGELVAKMDDDDRYGDEHLTDLVAAYRYAVVHGGAAAVGKWGQFVHLTGPDVTLSRQLERQERAVTHLPGGTFVIPADLLRRFGFSRVDTAVDTALWRRLRAAGATLYSTHRYNYTRVRHDDHTWTRSDEEFLAGAEGPVLPGLALDATEL